ncbi:MAG: alpha-ketoacid dehydrogenase subunit beta [Anaerolineales bacterium]|nr:alpha-ketoacid dehydrogenase subunit beta [Anaerolineales bacterium]
MTTVLNAINQALHACLCESEAVYILGENVLDPYGGAFKVSRGLSIAFPERVITTPVSEAGIVGVGVGMALRGLRPVIEIMFGDFITLTADQLINHAAKFRWMSSDQVSVPIVVRTPMGGGRSYGPTYSQTLEKHFLGTPGLRVIAPTALGDPEALLRTVVLHEDDPVLFIEHKLLYSLEVQSNSEHSEFVINHAGDRYPVYHVRLAGAPPPMLTLAAYGFMAELACKATMALAYEDEIFAEIIVPTQIGLIDLDFVLERASVTGKLLALEEGTLRHGWGAEVLAQTLERGGVGIRAHRIGAMDMPIPSAALLEAAVLPGEDDIISAVRMMTS